MKTAGKQVRTRMLVFLYIVIACCAVLVLRTGWIQFVEGDTLEAKAIQQQTSDKIVNPKRGTIYDRNMKALAVSASVKTISANPNAIRKDRLENIVAVHLSRILEMEYEDVAEILARNSTYEFIKRKVEIDQYQEIEKLIADEVIAGIDLVEDSKRYYPYNNFASHVIGFTGTDNQGLAGIELAYDDELKGISGRIVSARNAVGGNMPFDYEKFYTSEDGYNVVLTLDEVIQHYAESHLEAAVADNQLANGAAAIVMDVKTGEILAMTTKPDFNLNQPFTLVDADIKNDLEAIEEDEERNVKTSEALQKMWRNKAVSDMYEPGSVFKIFTAAIALEENLIRDNDMFTCSGVRRVATHNIHCWKTNGHGTQTFADAIKNSCNPAFMEIGDRIGADNFIKYVNGFNLVHPTGIDLPGEAEGLFFSRKNMGIAEIATSSFGQGFQVTPVQMISAIAAVANGGKYMKPHMVKALTDGDGRVVQQIEPEFVKQIISEETAGKLCTYLESVVSEGSGKNAYVQGFRVAGKTGTSEKTPRNQGKYIASFGGFAPADDPQIAVLVMLDEPMGGQYYGGTIAAPVVGHIMNDVLRYLNVEPRLNVEEAKNVDVSVPDVVGKSVSEAISVVQEAGFTYSVKGSGDKVKTQVPSSTARLPEGSTIVLYTEEEPAESIVVPNVSGMTPEQANLAIVGSGLNMKLTGNITGQGDSVVVSQEPAAGTQVQKGTVVYVEIRHLDVE
ncbi:MAG: PASTA domain-containing protein [Clostridia bacterium]|nr:PASTA domain-containing protein [Clostridia bacterium]